MTDRERRRREQLRAELTTIRDAAGVVRSAPELHRWAGLHTPRRAGQLGDLLDGLADHVDELDEHVRGHIVRVCGEILGRPMEQPTTRRTRHR